MTNAKKRSWKESLRSKAFWCSVGLFFTGVGTVIGGEKTEGAKMMWLGLMGMWGRHSISKLKNGA